LQIEPKKSIQPLMHTDGQACSHARKELGFLSFFVRPAEGRD